MLANCAPADPRVPPLLIERTVQGDTVVVETLSGSVWGRDRDLVPELAIGRENHDERSLLGDPIGLALLPDGGVAVLDRIGPRVLVFSAEGTFRNTVGRVGDGPGEYRRATGIAALPEGLIAVHEASQNKIMVFDTKGALVRQWSCLTINYLVHRSLSTDDAGAIILRYGSFAPSDPNFSSDRVGIARFTVDGLAVDSATVPAPDDPGLLVWPFHPKRFALWHPSGYAVSATSREYTFDLRRSQGEVLRVRRRWKPVRLAAEELDIWREVHRFMERRWSRELPDVPSVKPPFKDMTVSRTGEIWIHRHTSSVRLGPRPQDLVAAGGAQAIPWKEPLMLDVFDEDGRFLGSVKGRAGTEVLAISSDTVWAKDSGTYGEPIVVRFRARGGAM